MDSHSQHAHDDDLTLFAESDFRNVRHRLGIKRADRRYHMHMVGKTGIRKATVLGTLVGAGAPPESGVLPTKKALETYCTKTLESR